ncbi:selenide, water dikinase SelD [bacterium]|nr:selenide, water dikinase SelD [bacterium]
MSEQNEMRLTQMCSCAGCAAKIKAKDLEKVLQAVNYPCDPRALAGQSSGDDAVVVKISDDLALVQTIDFFTPVVDDPFRFGRVAAANALSDVYAMGGTPFTAMNVTCFPIKSMGTELLSLILKGGLEKVLESGAVMAGGHTVEDPEPKFGLAVTGLINPKNMVRKDGAKPGDILVLTKPLGTGVLNTAHKFNDIGKEELEGVLTSMETLNKYSSEAMVSLGIKAGTDVTGYGLFGHGLEMARNAGVCFEFQSSELPFLPGAREAYLRGNIPGGSVANLEYAKPFMEAEDGIAPEVIGLMGDAQTSGGLLMAVNPEKVDALLKLLKPLFAAPKVIGRVKVLEDAKYLRVLK